MRRHDIIRFCNILTPEVCGSADVWQHWRVITAPETRWLSLPELADTLSIGISKVRRLIEDHSLIAAKVDGVWKVPESFIRDGEPLVDLRGTVLVLHDSGYSDEEALRWLLFDEESIGTAPIDALRAGRKAEVRRVAQALGF